MEIKIALLRGINVGAHRRILMADLKTALKQIGLNDVVTYIQSGNLIFSSNKSNTILEAELSDLIKTIFNFEVPIIVRSKKEFQTIIKENPFNRDDTSKLHFTFLKTPPKENDITSIEHEAFEPDIFKIKPDVIYLHLENKYHKTKLSNAFFEKKLKTETTTRNWKTTLNLLELSKDFL